MYKSASLYSGQYKRRFSDHHRSATFQPSPIVCDTDFISAHSMGSEYYLLCLIIYCSIILAIYCALFLGYIQHKSPWGFQFFSETPHRTLAGVIPQLDFNSWHLIRKKRPQLLQLRRQTETSENWGAEHAFLSPVPSWSLERRQIAAES